MNKIMKSEYFLLSLIFILGLIVRLYKVNNPIADWHSWRQADTASVTRSFVSKGIKFLYPTYQDVSGIQSGIYNPKGYRFVELPLYNALHAILVSNFPIFSLELWGRFVSILCSLISAFFLYLIGKKFLGSMGGILTAFFFLFLPYNIYFSRVILPEPMAVALALSGMWFFVRFIEGNRWIWLYVSGVFMSLSMLLKPFTGFYLIPLFYLYFQKYIWKKTIKDAKTLIKLLIFADIVIIPFFAWRVWVNNFPAGIPFFEWAFNGDRIRFRPAFFRWIFAERIGKLILGIWGLVPFSIGLLTVKKSKLFSLMFFIGTILYVVVVATANVRHDYYQIFLIPPISLILAQGTLYLWKSKEFISNVAKPLTIFSIVMMIFVSFYQTKEYYKIDHPEIIEAGRAVDSLTPKDALVIASYNGDTAFLYQTNRWGWPVVDDSIENLIKKGADYYVSVNFTDPDTTYVMEKYKVIKKEPNFVLVDLQNPL
ncbi:ArnT family glycosyltransferase [Patescibacteria group bacterium]